jgi:hypothetical protein
MPGGFERCGFTLERDPRLIYPDLAELSTVTVQGAGGDVAWQGRLEKTPDTGGFQEQVSPEAVGYQAHLEDDNTAREIYVDRELSRWEGPTLRRQIEELSKGYTDEAPSIGVNPNDTPAVVAQATGPWETAGKALVEAWYDAKGVQIGSIIFYWTRGLFVEAANEHWHWLVIASSDDIGGAVDTSGNLRAAGPSSGSLNASPGRLWALLQFYYDIAGGTANVPYQVYWENLAVFGRHGLPGYATTDALLGLLASDVVAHALGRWAPKLTFTTGTEGTIQPSSFVIPQLAFLEPTTAAEILKQAIRFELQDWAVWENQAFYMNPRGGRGKEWRARVGPAQLQEAGPQVSRLWNGVIVQYTDVTGASRTVGPPGSGAEATSSQLIDEDPENPLNEIGIRKYAKLSMGTSTVAGATQVGAKFLTEQAELESSGQATIVGYVEDESGVLYPAWAIRAGDTIAFVDASDPSARRIVHASYEDASRSCQVQLDQPPDSLTAILERLSVAIQPLGFS